MTELEHNTRCQMLNDLASSNQPANRGSMALLFGVTVGRRSACQPVEPTKIQRSWERAELQCWGRSLSQSS